MAFGRARMELVIFSVKLTFRQLKELSKRGATMGAVKRCPQLSPHTLVQTQPFQQHAFYILQK